VKALIIDDNQSVRMFVERVLRDAGYETVGADDGISAQRLVLKAGAPDLVITDVSMPHMSGHEFAHWIRTSFPAVKVLFLTGYIDQTDRRSAGDLWVNVGYLEKPCTVRGLLQAVSLLMFRQLEPPAVLRQVPAL
jgi:two-component system, cell cycle sensor histidine kinase and response regulator CckA